MKKPAEYHHGNLRAALIEAGVRLIEEKDSIDISLREVAKSAGVSHSAPYRHFKDKNSLMAGIREVGFRVLADEMLTAAKKYPEAPKKQLVEAGLAYVRIALESRQMFHLMFSSTLACDDQDENLQGSSDEAFGGLVAIIKNGQAAGLFREADPAVLAMSAWSLVHGYATLASMGRLDQVVPDVQAKLQLAQQIEYLLIDGLVSHTGVKPAANVLH